MGSVSGGGVRGSESDRWKRGLLGRVDNAFFVRAQTTQVTQLQLRACLQKICMQKTHTHGMPKLLWARAWVLRGLQRTLLRCNLIGVYYQTTSVLQTRSSKTAPCIVLLRRRGAPWPFLPTQSPTPWKKMSEWLSWADLRRWIWIFYDC